MSKGVEIHGINVDDTEDNKVTLRVNLTIAADNEFDAIGWLVEVLGAEA